MDGVFKKKKLFFGITALVCGSFVIALSAFLAIVDTETKIETALGSVVAILIGCMFISFGVLSLRFNRGAFLQIGDDRLTAKYGINRSVDIPLEDIDLVWHGAGSLVIETKDKMRHEINGLINAYELCRYLRDKLECGPPDEDMPALKTRLKSAKARRRRYLLMGCAAFAFIFAAIFLTVMATGGRDLSDFSRRDWLIFIIFAALELLALVMAFRFASRSGKEMYEAQRLGAKLREKAMYNAPVLPGYAAAVYADADFRQRITVFNMPSMQSQYITVEEVTPDYGLSEPGIPEVFEDPDELEEVLKGYIKISMLPEEPVK
ncbi:MAG: hypothetical protein IKS19_02350 [Clostridia bacterium]|nr:hypothetical protein [Clostridia bacterium]